MKMGYSVIFIKNRIVWIILIILASISLTNCGSGLKANEYNLSKTINAGKFPSAEMDNIAYKLRKAIEQNHRWDTEWLTYWVNAEMTGRCGTIKVNDLQAGKSEVPLQPIDLQQVVSIETWIEYHSYTESQLINNQNETPVARTVKGTIVYKTDHWEVKSAEEMKESLGAYCP